MSTRDGLPVLIGGRRYEVDVEGITWRTVSPTRPGSDQGAGPGEQGLSSETVWRRTRNNWLLGAGQEYADVIEGSDDRRFFTSDGVDPWTARGLRMLPQADFRYGSGNTDLQMLTARVGSTDYLVFLDGGTVYFWADPTSGSPTAFTGASGVDSITTDGRRVWMANGADIFVGVPGTAAVGAAFSSYNAVLVGYANGRLLAASAAGELVEVLAAGTTTSLFTHPNTSFAWKGIASSPGGIYCFGDSGVHSEVFVVTAIDTSGALDVPFVAAELPDGEYLRAMCFYGGIMVWGTSRGVRLALITGGGFLSFGPVVDEPGDVRCLEPQGEDVWFGWTYGAEMHGLGRARLSRFTADLVPAFATDLMSRGSLSGEVLAVATHAGRRYFAIGGSGIYGESEDLELVGSIDLGWFDFGISEPKILDSLTVWCDELPAGCSIVANVYNDDDTTPLLTMTIDADGTRKQTATYTGSTEAERLRVTLTLNQSGTTSIVVRRVTLRAVPKPFVSEIIVLPLFLSDAVSSEGKEVGQDPWVEWQHLHGLVVSRERFDFELRDFTAKARLESVEVEKGGLGGGNGLNGYDDRGQFVAGKWEVVVVTAEPPG